MNDNPVTVEEIRLMPNVDSDISDDTIKAIIQDARLDALSDQFPKTVVVDGEALPILHMATKDMALHLLQMSSTQGQGVTSEKVDVISRTYASIGNTGWLNSSPWGKAYLRLYRLYGGGSFPRIAVVQH